MRSDYTHIVYLLDKSGSMERLARTTRSAFNEFLDDQARQPGECTLSLTQFCFNCVISEPKPARTVEHLTERNYKPGGGTALIDAIAKTITATGNFLNSMPEHERPAKVLFVIHTDGEENSSKEFTISQVRDMIKHQTDVYNWAFVYMGSDLASIEDAASFGLSTHNTMLFSGTEKGISEQYNILSHNVSAYRVADAGLTSTMARNFWDSKKEAVTPDQP